MRRSRRSGAFPDRLLAEFLAALPASFLAALLVALALLLFAGAVDGAGPPFPSPAANRSVYDPDRILKPSTLRTAETAADTIQTATGVRAVVYVERSPLALSPTRAGQYADALASQWQVGRAVVMLVDINADGCGGQVNLRRGTGLRALDLSDEVLAGVADTARNLLTSCNPDTAVLVGLGNLSVTLATAIDIGGVPPSSVRSGSSIAPGSSRVPVLAVPTGPPFPDPTPGHYVYDQAGVLRPETVTRVQAQIQAIRDRTGAEIVVYTQVVGSFESTETAEAHAIALMDQWGVGRRGFDDGLVILFDLDASRIHGQVQLYAGPGYRATFLNNQERQAIYEKDMLPLLQQADLNGALLVAMDKVDANATPEHAAALARARQLNAVVGLVGAPTMLILLVTWAAWNWLRFGRDPDYLDDPSIYMPAPPPDLTASAGALVYEGRSSRLTLTTAMLDLASRDELAFEPEEHRFGRDKLGLDIRDPNETDPRIGLNRRKPIGPAEIYALHQLSGLASTNEDGVRHVDSTALLGFGKSVDEFDTRLETYAAHKGWFRESPKASVGRWTTRGLLEALAGGGLIVLAFNLPSDGLLLIGGALLIAGLATMAIARAMPARTLPGATIRAMLAAYRRTLQKTLEQSRSMNEVVESKAVPWLETPDQAVVWGVALGLRQDVEDVMERTASDIQHGRADPAVTYVPYWYGSPGGGSSSVGGGAGGIAPGLFSGSAIPNFGGMMSAIGTIGNSPSSSGSGFGGGGSGGGGGGAGGGF